MSTGPRLAYPSPDRKALLGDGLLTIRAPNSDDVYCRLLPGGTRVTRALLPRRFTELIAGSGDDGKLASIPVDAVVILYWTTDGSPNHFAVLLDSLAPYI